MTGAMGLEGGVLEGEILLNLDTEEDDEIGIGCAEVLMLLQQELTQRKKLPKIPPLFQLL